MHINGAGMRVTVPKLLEAEGAKPRTTPKRTSVINVVVLRAPKSIIIFQFQRNHEQVRSDSSEMSLMRYSPSNQTVSFGMVQSSVWWHHIHVAAIVHKKKEGRFFMEC